MHRLSAMHGVVESEYQGKNRRNQHCIRHHGAMRTSAGDYSNNLPAATISTAPKA
jgi:hypothetical protein